MCYRYHLRDIVVGKIYFLLVRIKIKHMEVAIIKKETSGTRQFNETVDRVMCIHSLVPRPSPLSAPLAGFAHAGSA